MTSSHQKNKKSRKAIAQLAQLYPSIKSALVRWTNKVNTPESNIKWGAGCKLHEKLPVFIFTFFKYEGEGDEMKADWEYSPEELKLADEIIGKFEKLFGLQLVAQPIVFSGAIVYEMKMREA